MGLLALCLGLLTPDSSVAVGKPVYSNGNVDVDVIFHGPPVSIETVTILLECSSSGTLTNTFSADGSPLGQSTGHVNHLIRTSGQGAYGYYGYQGGSGLHYRFVLDPGAFGPGESCVALVVLSTGAGVATSPASDLFIPRLDAAPVARAGPDQAVPERTVVALDGTRSSDPDNGPAPLQYAWIQLSGPAITLRNATQAVADFMAPDVDADTNVTFALEVSDGARKDVDTVTVAILEANRAPKADAGLDQVVPAGAIVQLQGKGSDPDNNALAFAWTQTYGPLVLLHNATTDHPDFRAPSSDAKLRFQLVVFDGDLASSPDTVNVLVHADNHAPVADAGADQTARPGTVARLNGQASYDVDGDVLAYKWSQLSGPHVMLRNGTKAVADFAVAPGLAGSELAFTLTVSDGALTSEPSSTLVTVLPARLLTADAGLDQVVAAGTTVQLDGTGSTAIAPDGPLAYAWTQVGGGAVLLSDDGSSLPAFVAPAGVDNLTFRLVVSDDLGSSAPDLVTIQVRPPGFYPSPQQVEGRVCTLRFDSPVDIAPGPFGPFDLPPCVSSVDANFRLIVKRPLPAGTTLDFAVVEPVVLPDDLQSPPLGIDGPTLRNAIGNGRLLHLNRIVLTLPSGVPDQAGDYIGVEVAFTQPNAQFTERGEDGRNLRLISFTAEGPLEGQQPVRVGQGVVEGGFVTNVYRIDAFSSFALATPAFGSGGGGGGGGPLPTSTATSTATNGPSGTTTGTATGTGTSTGTSGPGTDTTTDSGLLPEVGNLRPLLLGLIVMCVLAVSVLLWKRRQVPKA